MCSCQFVYLSCRRGLRDSSHLGREFGVCKEGDSVTARDHRSSLPAGLRGHSRRPCRNQQQASPRQIAMNPFSIFFAWAVLGTVAVDCEVLRSGLRTASTELPALPLIDDAATIAAAAEQDLLTVRRQLQQEGSPCSPDDTDCVSDGNGEEGTTVPLPDGAAPPATGASHPSASSSVTHTPPGE